MHFNRYHAGSGKNRSTNVNFVWKHSDWTGKESQFDQSVSRQSCWSAEPLRTISNPNSQIKPSLSNNSIKLDAWNESMDAELNLKNNSRSSQCKMILIGLGMGLLIAGVALGIILALWLNLKSAVTTTSEATTGSTTSVTSTTTSTSTSTSTTTSVTTTTAAIKVVYSQSFTSGATPSTQCTAWTNFVAQLTSSSYTLLTMNGTLDSGGVTVIDPVVIANIALALRTSTSYGAVTSNGRSWMVGSCGGGYELSASGSICQCPSPNYLVRPCIGNSNYGGINSATCGGPSQTMTVIFQ